MNTTLASQAPRFLRIVFALGAILTLSAFRHTDIEGYTDPNYVGYKFRTVVIQFPNASLSFKKHLIKQLGSRFKKLNIRMLQHDQLFAPTREWSEEDTRAVYERHGVDAGVVITIGETSADVTPGGILYNGSTIGGTTTGYATQVSLHSDRVSFQIALVDIDTKNTVWVGDLDTRGAGMLYTGPKSTAKGMARKLFKEWKSVGHLPRK